MPKLTRKQKIFVDYVLDHPKESYTQAAVVAYGASNRGVASSIAAENLTKPAIKMALGKANDLVESTLTTVVEEWGSSTDVQERSLAINTARYIHDKIHGKATQRTEVTSNVVSISLDLTGGDAGNVPAHIQAQLQG